MKSLDAETVLSLAARIIKISVSAYSAYRQAVAEEGADDALLAELDQKYEARIAHERQVGGN